MNKVHLVIIGMSCAFVIGVGIALATRENSLKNRATELLFEDARAE